MNKSKTKDGLPTQAKRYNVLVVERLAEKYGVTQRFVRQCLSGDRQSETADTIKKEYRELDDAIGKVLQ